MNMQSETPATFAGVTVGARWKSPPRTLTEAELMWACMLTGDWHPIHASAPYAAESPVGQRTFHGGYGILLALGAVSHFPEVGMRGALALGTDAWKFRAPLFIGDTIHVEIEIIGLRRTSDGKRMVVERRVQLVKADGETAQEGNANLLVYLDPALDAERPLASQLLTDGAHECGTHDEL